MNAVFADTVYWIALFNPRDRLHQLAIGASRRFAETHVVTSQMVLAEFLNDFAGRGPQMRAKAASGVANLHGRSDVEIVRQSDELFLSALRRYIERPDKNWSLTDCSSMLIMEERGIQEALTYDIHFQQAGFKALLRS